MIQDDHTVIEPTLKELKTNQLNGQARSIGFRKQQLQNLLRGLTEMQDEFIDALFKDLGYKDKFYCGFQQMSLTLNSIQHDIANITNYNKTRSMNTYLFCGPGKSYLVPEPYGVVLVMGAWNFPVYTCVPQAATAIAMGNAVVLKPSELSPNVSNKIAKLFKTYLDNSLYRVIEGGLNVAINITKQPFDLIVFTGGTEKGKLVAKAAADNLVPCILELGGKSPCIVDSTGDLVMAAKRLLHVKTFNSGQVCIAPDYILLQEDQQDRFLPLLVNTLQEFYTDKPADSQYLSTLINEFHTQRVIGYLTDHGGKVLAGGKHDLAKKWIEPTLILNPSPTSKVMQDEIFGPILPIITYKTNADAIKFINSRSKPLALYYFGTSDANKNQIVQQTSAGGVCINDCMFHAVNHDLPFGGVGQSGYGSYSGRYGFAQFCHLKPVLEKSTLEVAARYPPYNSSKIRIMNGLVAVGHIKQAEIVYALIAIVIAIILWSMCGCCHGKSQDL